MENVITMRKPQSIREGLSVNEERRRAEFDRESGLVCGMVNSASKKNIERGRENAALRAKLETQNAALAQALSDTRYSHIAGWFLAGMATMALIFTILNF